MENKAAPPSRAPSPAPSSTPSVQVFCRFRPQNSIETSHHGVNVVKSNQTSCTVSLPNAQESDPEQIFTFDRVFAPNSSQEEIFDRVVSPLVDDSLNGYNCTVIAYGQTGSGKTHTMEGPPSCSFSDPESGVLPRVATKLFSTVASRKLELVETAFECTVVMSVIEIYLEKIVDLLDTSSLSTISKKNGDGELLRIREDTSGSVYLEGVVEHTISDPSGLLRCLSNASQKRSTGAHSMNARSSRSHLVAIITITQKTSTTGTTSGKLYICDLAGSETVRKTGAGGKRLKEAQAINRSLSALGNVIKALTPVDSGGGSNSAANNHVPYRDSKLTRLLQDSLGGNAKTALIVTCSVSSYNVSETMSTLRFGNRAKRMRNKAKVNKKMSYDELIKLVKRLEKENNLFRGQVEVLERENRRLAGARGGIRGVRNVMDGNSNSNSNSNSNRNSDSDSDSDDDDEGVGAYLPNDDDDLKVDEERERLEAELKRLKLLIESMEESNLTEEERRKKKDTEGEEERRKLAESLNQYKEESLNQYTKGWQVGQRAASLAYNSGNSDFTGEDKKAEEDEGGKLQIKVDEEEEAEVEEDENVEESFCQICGLGETETKDHEDVNNKKLGPMFNCDGNCSSFFHTSCANLSSLPTGEWFCAECGEVTIDDPLPSPMRVEHTDFDQAAAASLAELSAVRGRFIALRKQRDRLIARWKGERESQRRVEGAKRKLRKKREEEICRLREVVLVLQEEVDMSEEDRGWLMQVMDSTVAFSPNRMKRGRKGKGKGKRSGKLEAEVEMGAVEEERVVQKAPTLDIPSVEEMVASKGDERGGGDDDGAHAHTQNVLQATSTELTTVQKQFESAKQQILKQQRQLQKYQKVIQEQQSKLSGLKAENSELLSVGKANTVLASSPFGPLNSSSLPSSPTPDSAENVGSGSNGEAFKTMKTWWAGELEDVGGSGGEKPPLSPPKVRQNGGQTSGVVKAQAESLTAPFRNRLIGLLSSIEKEAKDYNNLKERISAENTERRDSRLTAKERRAKRLEESEGGDASGGSIAGTTTMMSKTQPAMRSESFNDLDKA